jgi:hypothetical protein
MARLVIVLRRSRQASRKAPTAHPAIGPSFQAWRKIPGVSGFPGVFPPYPLVLDLAKSAASAYFTLRFLVTHGSAVRFAVPTLVL